MRRFAVLGVVIVLGLFLAGCGSDEPAATEPGGEETSEAPDEAMGAEVLVTAEDYKFDLAASYPAGTTSFTLVNEGEEPHFIDIVPLTEDAPALDELLKLSDKKVGEFFAGPPNHVPTVKPGETSEPLEIELVPGRYGYVCFIEAKDGTPHAFLGMAGEFTVE